MKRLITSLIVAAAFAVGVQAHAAEELDLTKPETYDKIMDWAKQPLDTAKYKKDGALQDRPLRRLPQQRLDQLHRAVRQARGLAASRDRAS